MTSSNFSENTAKKTASQFNTKDLTVLKPYTTHQTPKTG